MKSFLTRAGTSDDNIFRAINDPQFNEYRLPESFSSEDIIIDVGMHIGSFSYACLTRGAGRIYSYEAWVENYELACHNLRDFNERAILYNFAVWRSDLGVEMPTLHFAGSTDPKNTGGGNVVFGSEGIRVRTQSLDDIIIQIDRQNNIGTMQNGKRIRLLKLDCEASEFPILFTCTLLNRVEAIHGEFHEIGGQYNNISIPEASRVEPYTQYTLQELTDFLTSQGFNVTSHRHPGSNLGLFFATRE